MRTYRCEDAGPATAGPAQASIEPLQRLKEGNQLVLLCSAQIAVVVDDSSGLAAVPQNGLIPCEREQVVHQREMGAHAPQRWGAHHVRGSLAAVLDDAVSGSYVVQQEVGVWVDGLAAERRRYGEGAPVNHGSGRSRGDRRNVADGAADLVKEVGARLSVGCGSQRCIARRRLGGAHKAGKVIDILQPVRAGLVFGVGCGLANRGGVGGVEPVGDALLVQVRVTGERQKAGLLVLPAKPAAANRAAGFRYRDLDERSGDKASALARLVLCNLEQCVAVDGLNKTIAESIGGGTQRADVLRARHAFFSDVADGTLVDQRSVRDAVSTIVDEDGGIHEVAEGVLMSNTQFGELAGAAHVGRGVAVHAGTGVIHRAYALRNVLFVHEGHFVSGKRRGIGEAVAY